MSTQAPTTISTIDRRFVMDRQGKDFVLYAGLLDKATEKGLRRLVARLVQIPTQDNGMVAICAAEAEFEDGRIFADIGDASPGNVGPKIAAHIIRMASTRAKARVLRDGLNIGGAAFEELGPDDDAEEMPVRAVQRQAPARATTPTTQTPEDTSAAYTKLLALQQQIQAITGEVIESPEGMSLMQCRGEYRRLEKLLREAQATHPQGPPTGAQLTDAQFIGADIPATPSLTKGGVR
jgi:hypothetical protein